MAFRSVIPLYTPAPGENVRLFARLRHVLTLALGGIAPLEKRVAALEARLEELDAIATDREIRWAEMNAQLRRYLGRLDAHAGRVKEDRNGGPHGARADVIAAKYPGGLPTKE